MRSHKYVSDGFPSGFPLAKSTIRKILLSIQIKRAELRMDCLTRIQKDLQRCIGFVLLLPSSAVQHWLNDLPYLSLLTLVIALHVRMERENAKSKKPPPATLPLFLGNLNFTLT